MRSRFPASPLISSIFLFLFLILAGCGFSRLRVVHTLPLFFYPVDVVAISSVLVCPRLCYFVSFGLLRLRVMFPRVGANVWLCDYERSCWWAACLLTA